MSQKGRKRRGWDIGAMPFAQTMRKEPVGHEEKGKWDDTVFPEGVIVG